MKTIIIQIALLLFGILFGLWFNGMFMSEWGIYIGDTPVDMTNSEAMREALENDSAKWVTQYGSLALPRYHWSFTVPIFFAFIFGSLGFYITKFKSIKKDRI